MALSEPRNRYVLVAASTAINGIDFVELKSIDATTLYVHFINAVTVATTGIVAAITGGDRIRDIQVNAIDNATDWSVDADGRPLLTLTVDEAGDFSEYTLTITGPAADPTGIPLDPFFNSTAFSFKVLCSSDFDCRTECEPCPVDTPPLPAIDYLAKDFQSFKLALTDFSAQRYPAWQERSEADFGVMFMEALCYVADELSYLQDRVAAEATLATATQRRSLVSMARLVDYEPQPALSASTTIQCNVVTGTVAAGLRISARAPDGSLVPFEIGTGLADTTTYAVNAGWNDGVMQPYWFDDSQSCLSCGATQMYIQGHGLGFSTTNATPLLIQTDLPGKSIREIVDCVLIAELTDPIYLTGGLPTPVTLIGWDASDALQYEHDLTATRVAGNLLPATQGQRFSDTFAIDVAPAAKPSTALAIARMGPNGSACEPNWIYRYPLSRGGLSRAGTTGGRLAWLPSPEAGPAQLVDPDIATPLPELILSRVAPTPATLEFATSLLDATGTELAFTIDPQAWRVVAADSLGNPTQWDYDGDQGDTLRFGDGNFGQSPDEGDVYEASYRIGLGAAGNVAADAINIVDASAVGSIITARNPFLVTDGADQETAQHVQRMAPQAFRAIQYRAVRPEDYEAAAESLPWVLKAGTAFRWTGSWLSVFTTADPRQGSTGGNEGMSETGHEGLIDLLNRRRLAGYESFAPTPDLVSIDLKITVCVKQGWGNRDVESGVLKALANAQNPDGGSGFFFADRFTFGTPLYRSRLEAAVQAVAGVSGVLDVEYRKRGASMDFSSLPEILPLSTSQILRVDNDPSYPERGTIRVIPEGGQ